MQVYPKLIKWVVAKVYRIFWLPDAYKYDVIAITPLNWLSSFIFFIFINLLSLIILNYKVLLGTLWNVA